MKISIWHPSRLPLNFMDSSWDQAETLCYYWQIMKLFSVAWERQVEHTLLSWLIMEDHSSTLQFSLPLIERFLLVFQWLEQYTKSSWHHLDQQSSERLEQAQGRAACHSMIRNWLLIDRIIKLQVRGSEWGGRICLGRSVHSGQQECVNPLTGINFRVLKLRTPPKKKRSVRINSRIKCICRTVPTFNPWISSIGRARRSQETAILHRIES